MTNARGGEAPGLLLIEDDAGTNRRSQIIGVADAATNVITVSLHEVGDTAKHLTCSTYMPARTGGQNGRTELILKLLTGYLPFDGVVAAGTRFTQNSALRLALDAANSSFVLELTPALYRRLARLKRHSLIKRGTTWHEIAASHPVTGKPSVQRITMIEPLDIRGRRYPAVAFQFGRVDDKTHQIRIAILSSENVSVEQAAHALAWVRWIQSTRRRTTETIKAVSTGGAAVPPRNGAFTLQARSNIQLARQQDLLGVNEVAPSLKGYFSQNERTLNTVELFAGAGGMGLGFLMSEGDYRLVTSAEVHPIYTETLRRNHEWLAAHADRKYSDRVPSTTRPVDLREAGTLSQVENVARSAGDVHVVVGGPPCQGFSNANRNSWSSHNPHNELVDVFFRYVRRLNPAVFVMENVQGILWTRPTQAGESAIEQYARRATRDGYRVFPKLLDAVWYGVPQYRSRFFLVGVHRDLGYHRDDFGDWGPFPHPTHGAGTDSLHVSVADAIADLPVIENGQQDCEMPYRAPRKLDPFMKTMRRWCESDVITDHVASRHAPYVIRRYERIPKGGNWSDIRDELTNYADVERTHSNIYRRLAWGDPAVTIGHYRKSMLVHPAQHRGLSLREAARLQSFPDWFRFAGSETEGDNRGLGYKQQQLANAVAPLLMKALADFIAGL